MNVLVTRAEGDAEKLAARLAERGHDSIIENLMTIRFQPEAARSIGPFLDGVQAVLFTSANGVRAFADATMRRDFRAFAVGDATAAAAREVGFADVTSAQGAVDDLAKLVMSRLKAKDGAVFHAAASVTAGDLQGLLEAAGYSVRRAALYVAVESERLSDLTRAAIARHEIDAALFFSPRNAATFVRLAAGLEEGCKRMVAVALSSAVAEKLAPLPWRRVAVASAPNEPALLATLESSLAAS
ncbi:MAG TPA: uroporphyrinogen-III synthase [Stellaceae bacterium]|jgi:uroporphyrinogen-III synthase|nr:uroporphyrinogen-III synthase [Stellaceae bacterium]